MSKQLENIQENVKQITCILPKGKSLGVQESLIAEHQIYDANFHYARGVGKLSAERGLGGQREKEILEVMVPQEKADEIFNYIFFKAEMDRPHGGIMFMVTLPKMSTTHLPDIPPEAIV